MPGKPFAVRISMERTLLMDEPQFSRGSDQWEKEVRSSEAIEFGLAPDDAHEISIFEVCKGLSVALD